MSSVFQSGCLLVDKDQQPLVMRFGNWQAARWVGLKKSRSINAEDPNARTTQTGGPSVFCVTSMLNCNRSASHAVAMHQKKEGCHVEFKVSIVRSCFRCSTSRRDFRLKQRSRMLRHFVLHASRKPMLLLRRVVRSAVLLHRTKGKQLVTRSMSPAARKQASDHKRRRASPGRSLVIAELRQPPKPRDCPGAFSCGSEVNACGDVRWRLLDEAWNTRDAWSASME